MRINAAIKSAATEKKAEAEPKPAE
jgi:hypothetical protein